MAGCLGSLLGISGGIFLVPFLILALELPVRTAVAISLMTVIATSSVASANEASQRLLNLRLGMLLQLTSTVGVLTGGLTAMVISEQAVLRLFAIISVVSAIIIFSRLGRRNVTLDPDADPGRLGGRFFEQESGGVVTYRVRRVWLGLGVSFIAGNLASVLGIGGGIITVPVLNVWCGVPMRVAAATSAFLIGITAVAAIPARTATMTTARPIPAPPSAATGSTTTAMATPTKTTPSTRQTGIPMQTTTVLGSRLAPRAPIT